MVVFFFFFFSFFFFFFKQKTAYEIVSRDWSSDVCSSDLVVEASHTLIYNAFSILKCAKLQPHENRQICSSTYDKICLNLSRHLLNLQQV